MQHEWAAHGYGIVGKGTRRGSDNNCGPEREMQLLHALSQTKIQTPSQRAVHAILSHIASGVMIISYPKPLSMNSYISKVLNHVVGVKKHFINMEVRERELCL